MAFEDKITIHTCEVCSTSGTNLRFVFVRDENEKALAGVCADCWLFVREELKRLKKEKKC